jgi:hypothetical protein
MAWPLPLACASEKASAIESATLTEQRQRQAYVLLAGLDSYCTAHGLLFCLPLVALWPVV